MSGKELRSGKIIRDSSEIYSAKGQGTPKFLTPKPIGRFRHTKFKASIKDKETTLKKPNVDVGTASSLDRLLATGNNTDKPVEQNESLEGSVLKVIEPNTSDYNVQLTSDSDSDTHSGPTVDENFDIFDSSSEDGDNYILENLPFPFLPVEPLEQVRPFLPQVPIPPPLPPLPGGIENNLVIFDNEVENINMAQNLTACRPPTFHGSSREDGIEFMRLFKLYCEMHGVQMEEADPPAAEPATADACRRFKLCISGDAARWCSELPGEPRWPDIEAAFEQKYCNLANSWAENVKLRNIVQLPGEPVEIYLEKFCDQARRMGKNLATCVTDMVEGMLPDIQREVLMKAPGNVEDMLTHAKLADTVSNKPAVVGKSTPRVSHLTKEKKSVGELTDLVQELK